MILLVWNQVMTIEKYDKDEMNQQKSVGSKTKQNLLKEVRKITDYNNNNIKINNTLNMTNKKRKTAFIK